MKILKQSNGGLYFQVERSDRRASAFPQFIHLIRCMEDCVFRPAEMDDRPGESENRWCWVPPGRVQVFEEARRRYIDDFLESDRIVRSLGLS